jgi:hypothetical protein
MFNRFLNFRRLAIVVLLGLPVFLAACGGGGSSDSQPLPSTGTIALLLTDMPTDDLLEIKLDVTEAILIGGDGQQTLYSNPNKPIHVDLLKLENFNVPIAFEEVPAGVYTKLRLRLTNLTLVDKDLVEHHPPLPANGKVDMLHPEGFEVLPGRTLLVEADMDANKSIHVVQTGNGKYRVRPVVFVKFMNEGMPDKLARIEGRIDEMIDAEAGVFVLCSLGNPDACVDVSLTTDGCVYDGEGVPTEPTALAEDDEVVVIGRYSRSGNDVMLDAIVVEQGPAEQLTGTVNSLPDENGMFLMLDREGTPFTVELQADCTQVLDPDGAIVGAAGLQIGQGIEVEGTRIVPETEGDPATLRAALVIIDGDDAEERVIGTISPPFDEDTSSFFLTTTAPDGGVTVVLDPDATIIVFDGGEQKSGEFVDIVNAEGRAADVYGELGTDAFFHATSVVVEPAE